MRRSDRRVLPLPIEELAVVASLAAVVLLVTGAWLACVLAGATGVGSVPPGGPVALLPALVHRHCPWTPGDWAWLAAEAVAGVAVSAGVWRLVRRGGRRLPVDRQARSLPLPRNPDALRRYTDPSAGPTPEAGPGPVIGRDVVSGQVVRATWEDVAVTIAGQRMGKTTGWVVPAILDAPGTVYATSNKRDIVDMTRGAREHSGEVWVFDPQRLCGGTGPPSWWWDPLEMARDVAGARLLAGLFSAASRPVGATTDAYFDPEGEELLALFLLAAACARRPITDVFTWLTDPTDTTPVGCLRDAGLDLPAKAVRAVLDHPEKQRAGVYGTAKKMVTWLSDPGLVEWVTDPAGRRPVLRVDAFVAGTGTLYGLSKHGPGSAGALTGALTAGVLQAAERLATRSPGGRLSRPMVCALDEVANVCRWRDLPDLYSHYGSRGIVLLSFLQSWSQGVEVWGREGMARLWGSANIRVYGGGVSEVEYLEAVSRVCGEVDRPTTSVSDSRGGRSVSSSQRKERIFSVEALAALPGRRAVVMLSGTDPVLVAVEPCFASRWATAVRDSVARYGAAGSEGAA